MAGGQPSLHRSNTDWNTLLCYRVRTMLSGRLLELQPGSHPDCCAGSRGERTLLEIGDSADET